MKKCVFKLEPTRRHVWGLEYHFDHAAQLVENLLPTGPIWNNPYFGIGPLFVNRFIFRGQGASSWKLLPRILRTDVDIPIVSKGRIRPSLFGTKIYQEIDLLKKFFLLADRCGLQVPAEGFKYLLNLWRNFKSEEDRIGLYRNWPGEEIYELLAIAQHHGLPTRLLDFTHNPFKAIFFAVKDQQNDVRAAGERNSQVVIWAIQRFRAYFDRYVEISVPRSLNVNINSQEGLFQKQLAGYR